MKIEFFNNTFKTKKREKITQKHFKLNAMQLRPHIKWLHRARLERVKQYEKRSQKMRKIENCIFRISANKFQMKQKTNRKFFIVRFLKQSRRTQLDYVCSILISFCVIDFTFFVFELESEIFIDLFSGKIQFIKFWFFLHWFSLAIIDYSSQNIDLFLVFHHLNDYQRQLQLVAIFFRSKNIEMFAK